MGALVDVSVTQFAVARARKHNQQDTEFEGPQAGTYPMLTMVFASKEAATVQKKKEATMSSLKVEILQICMSRHRYGRPMRPCVVVRCQVN